MNELKKIDLNRFGVETSAITELVEAHNNVIEHVLKLKGDMKFILSRVDRFSEQWDKFAIRVSKMCTNLPPVEKPEQCPKDSELLPEERVVNEQRSSE